MKSPVADDAATLAEETYVYGYPLVTMEMTRRLMTNVATPEGLRAPMGQFVHARAYPGADFRDVTTPNADTLYSAVWLDVSDEPYVFGIPDMGDRYFVFPMLDAWTNVFQSPGTRTTGSREQMYAITAPGWKGSLPQGIKGYASPTGLVWIIGRTYCTGTPEDYAKVHRIQDQLKLVPLNKLGQPYQPPPGLVVPRLDMKTATRDQVHNLSGDDFFKLLAELMKTSPPAEADAPMVKRLAALGIVPGHTFDAGRLAPAVRQAIDRAPAAAQHKIRAQVEHIGNIVNGWLVPLRMGVYGTDYAHRAGVAVIAIGSNLPEDSVYLISKTTANGRPYLGANKYVVHFAKEDLPPVRGFWSLTLYDEQMFFVDNRLDKYTVSPRDELRFNADGSLDIYIQRESAGEDVLSNWLPAPTGRFNLVLRLYWPDKSVLSGQWEPPPVEEQTSMTQKAATGATSALSDGTSDVAALAEDAYVYGYPLVTMELTRRLMTNAATPEGLRAPMGQFSHARAYPGADFRDVTTPNADTLYSFAWIDVSDEPFVLGIPALGDRYSVFQLLDAWTNVFQSPGKRTTGTQAQKCAITGPAWKGTLPDGVKEYKSPTSLVWIIGRVYCTGTPEDYARVHRIQDQLELVPLSKFGQPYRPPRGRVDPSLDMKTATRDQVHALRGEAFFRLIAELMKKNPPAAADAPMLVKLAKLGIVPGQALDTSGLSAAQRQAIERAPTAAQRKILAAIERVGTLVNGWIVVLQYIGAYGTDYAQRASVAMVGVGANLPEDAVYPLSKADPDGHPYSGVHNYVLHFAKGELPPVNAFWSLTMYDDSMFFVDNQLDKYTVSARDALRFNGDGSLDIYLQHEPPTEDKQVNWLPAPTGRFNLMLRLYWPEQSVIAGDWQPPPIEQQQPAIEMHPAPV